MLQEKRLETLGCIRVDVCTHVHLRALIPITKWRWGSLEHMIDNLLLSFAAQKQWQELSRSHFMTSRKKGRCITSLWIWLGAQSHAHIPNDRVGKVDTENAHSTIYWKDEEWEWKPKPHHREML